VSFAITISFPIVAIVYEEVGDFAEDFERDSVAERHDGDVDDGMMSDGNGGVMLFCGGFLQWCVYVLVRCGISYGSWFLFFVFPLFLCTR
jgi:hypothetical protein